MIEATRRQGPMAPLNWEPIDIGNSRGVVTKRSVWLSCPTGKHIIPMFDQDIKPDGIVRLLCGCGVDEPVHLVGWPG